MGESPQESVNHDNLGLYKFRENSSIDIGAKADTYISAAVNNTCCKVNQ